MSGVAGEILPASVLSSIAMQIAVLDSAGTIVAVNDAWSDFARDNGGSEALAAGIGLNYLDVCQTATGPCSEEAGSAYDGLAAVLAGRNATFALEYPCHAPTKQRWFLLTATPLKAPTKGAVVSHLDVTRRKLVELALAKSRASLAIAQQIAQLANWEIDLRTADVFWSDEMFQILELDPETTRPSVAAYLAVVHADDQAVEEAAYRDSVRNGEPYEVVIRLETRSGSIKWVQERGQAYYDDKGAPIRAVGTILDVTARVEAEAERARLEAKGRAFLESAPDALIVVERSGEIALANAQAVDMFGYSPEELIGRPVEDLIPERFRPDHPGQRRLYFQDTRTRPMGVGRELYGKARDGREFAVEITLSPVGGNSEQQVVAAVRDISERRRLELNSRALREELAHVSRLSTMAEFATGLAHELNQPLTGITQYCDAALSTASEGAVDPEIKDLLVMIQEEAYRAAEIIRALRRFVRKDPSIMVADDLNEIVTQTVRLIEAEARDKEVVLALDLDDGLPRVAMDRVQIAQVLLNLLRNSLDALENATADTRRILVETSRAGREVLVLVEDTGPGVASGVDVFEPFETGKREGMGVGLSISRSIIEGHHGTLTVHDRGGKGACFRFTLPTGDS